MPRLSKYRTLNYLILLGFIIIEVSRCSACGWVGLRVLVVCVQSNERFCRIINTTKINLWHLKYFRKPLLTTLH